MIGFKCPVKYSKAGGLKSNRWAGDLAFNVLEHAMGRRQILVEFSWRFQLCLVLNCLLCNWASLRSLSTAQCPPALEFDLAWPKI